MSVTWTLIIYLYNFVPISFLKIAGFAKVAFLWGVKVFIFKPNRRNCNFLMSMISLHKILWLSLIGRKGGIYDLYLLNAKENVELYCPNYDHILLNPREISNWHFLSPTNLVEKPRKLHFVLIKIAWEKLIFFFSR